MSAIHSIIQVSDQGRRLDSFLRPFEPEISRNRIQDAIRSGMITVNGKTVKTGYPLSIGDRIEGEIQTSEPDSPPVAEAIPLQIIFEDDHLLVVNKPAGIVVHPAAGHARSTLVNALLYHIRNLSTGNHPQRPGIVHRLDKDTSGLMMVAKNDLVHAQLSQALKNRQIGKYYLALVWNTPSLPEGRIDLPLGRHPRDRKLFIPYGLHARDALTEYQVLQSLEIVSLLQLKLITGRTHQIRVHLESIHHPVVGDSVYGCDRHYCRFMPALYRRNCLPALNAVPRQMLHAWKIQFTHPVTGADLLFYAPLPPDFAGLLHQLQMTTPVPGHEKLVEGPYHS